MPYSDYSEFIYFLAIIIVLINSLATIVAATHSNTDMLV